MSLLLLVLTMLLFSLWLGTPTTKRIRFSVYFDTNANIDIMVHFCTSSLMLKEAHLMDSYELQYINSNILRNMKTTSLYCVNKEYIVPKYITNTYLDINYEIM